MSEDGGMEVYDYGGMEIYNENSIIPGQGKVGGKSNHVLSSSGGSILHAHSWLYRH